MVLYGPDGNVKQHVVGSNVVVDNGVEKLVEHLASANAAATTFTFNYIAVGTDSTAENSTDTDLGAEIGRHTGVASYVSNAIYRVTATLAAGSGTGAIVEYGLFNSNTAGTLFARDTESVINKGAGDSLKVVADYTFSGS